MVCKVLGWAVCEVADCIVLGSLGLGLNGLVLGSVFPAYVVLDSVVLGDSLSSAL